jgi:hypothetical protein
MINPHIYVVGIKVPNFRFYSAEEEKKRGMKPVTVDMVRDRKGVKYVGALIDYYRG